jgi:CheY-like chemotaxis protein
LSGHLKVLLADCDAGRARVLELRLREITDASIVRVPAGSSLRDAVSAESPDVIIVDMARPDRDALDDLRRVSTDNPRPIIMFVDRDDRGFMEDAIAAGVSSYNVVNGLSGREADRQGGGRDLSQTPTGRGRPHQGKGDAVRTGEYRPRQGNVDAAAQAR